MNIPYDLMVLNLKNDECKQYVENRYPTEWSYFDRFSKRNGPACPFSRASLREIFRKEYSSFGETFLCALGSHQWGTSKYQEGII